VANTTKGFPYPEDTDAADVPSDVQLLAEAVDAAPGIASLTQAQIDALSAAQKWAGRVVWNQTSNKLQRSNGSTFADMPTTADVAVLSNDTPASTGTAAAGTGATASRSDHVHAIGASPALTGTPTAPTAAANTNTTQIATTAFVIGQAATGASPMDGTAAVGTSTRFARQDHVHASDTTKARLDSPSFTGTVSLPSTTSIGSVSATEIGYLDGVTSALQTQLAGKWNAKVSDTAPTSPAEGDVWVDTTGSTTVPKVWNGSSWATFSTGSAVISGTPTGTYTSAGVNYAYYRYTASTSVVVTTAGVIDFTLIGGGGGGGCDRAAGGGGAGATQYLQTYIPAGTYSLTIGAGGAGATSSGAAGSAGANSTFGSVAFASLGGAGGGAGGTGGSGGSIGYNNYSNASSSGGNGGNGVASSGITGGNGANGGVILNLVDGTTTRAGGGGGGGGWNANGGSGGSNGGGAGGGNSLNNAVAGTANSGGGGGGGANGSQPGKNGGSGVFIIRVRT
jgi:hypothetical protein